MLFKKIQLQKGVNQVGLKDQEKSRRKRKVIILFYTLLKNQISNRQFFFFLNFAKIKCSKKIYMLTSTSLRGQFFNGMLKVKQRRTQNNFLFFHVQSNCNIVTQYCIYNFYIFCHFEDSFKRQVIVLKILRKDYRGHQYYIFDFYFLIDRCTDLREDTTV
eukprot:TRINITY_DN9622_c0_g1_i4.p2 TRINITY_DN9622_c0_g1~~TRINITY_DN9622_c0_g1_i4.p2  ORF type:complete len:160 (+),score=0.04 TRINITY_DN9622_c0_g1_i4:408-887(+)